MQELLTLYDILFSNFIKLLQQFLFFIQLFTVLLITNKSSNIRKSTFRLLYFQKVSGVKQERIVSFNRRIWFFLITECILFLISTTLRCLFLLIIAYWGNMALTHNFIRIRVVSKVEILCTVSSLYLRLRLARELLWARWDLLNYSHIVLLHLMILRYYMKRNLLDLYWLSCLESIIGNKCRTWFKCLASPHHIWRRIVEINLRTMACNSMYLWGRIGNNNMRDILNITTRLELSLKWLMPCHLFKIRLLPVVLIMFDLYIPQLIGNFRITIEQLQSLSIVILLLRLAISLLESTRRTIAAAIIVDP